VTTTSRYALPLQVALVAVAILACSDESEPRVDTCAAALQWRAAAQEWLYVVNEQSGPFEEWVRNFNGAFHPLGNVALPLNESDPESRLLPLMRRWRAEVEEWMSITSRMRDAEPARLQMNATIQDASGLLQTECGLEPLRLYQERPSGT
jgi:hypothetical protein